MKIQAFLKIAVVATAALAAYAFSGNNANLQSQFSFYDDMSNCRDITAECSDVGGEKCIIKVNNSSKSVLGLGCTTEIEHVSAQPVNWSYLPNN